ncbi:MAG: hypothetical protein QME44_03375 [Thermodesulfobacteriota bacterium]|nr:hypothetical protein [Thermodesulfobacteriota bacterium]
MSEKTPNKSMDIMERAKALKAEGFDWHEAISKADLVWENGDAGKKVS